MQEQILLANMSALGFNWIYDRKFLKDYAINHTLLMQVPDPDIYQKAEKGFYAYPTDKVGVLSFQGQIFQWLLKAWSTEVNFTQQDYAALIYEKIRPGGEYFGYVESFGKKLIYNRLIKDLQLSATPIAINDDQLVGFIPYIVGTILKKTLKESFTLAQVFTSDQDYFKFYGFLEKIRGLSSLKERKKAIIDNQELIPPRFLHKIMDAVKFTHLDEYMDKYMEVSCDYFFALPLIMYLYTHYESLYEGLEVNVLLGGASMDRGLILGFIYPKSPLPDDWGQYLK